MSRKTLKLSVKAGEESTISELSSIDETSSTTITSPPSAKTRSTPRTNRSIRTPKRKELPVESKSGDEPELRIKMKNKFKAVFPEKNHDLALICENVLYEHTKAVHHCDYPDSRFVQPYVGKGLNLLRNLDPTGSIGNDYLLPRVISGEIQPNLLVQMSDQQLYPPKWQKIKDQQLKDISVQTEEKVLTTSMYTCLKCKESKCTYFQRQTRSCDEPMTTFITCLNCGNHWRD